LISDGECVYNISGFFNGYLNLEVEYVTKFNEDYLKFVGGMYVWLNPYCGGIEPGWIFN
jgi:hypothetical protein